MLYNYKTRTRYENYKKKIHSPEPIFIIRNAISTGSAAFGARFRQALEHLELIQVEGRRFHAHHWLIPIPSLHFITKLPFCPLIVMYFSSSYVFLVQGLLQTFYFLKTVLESPFFYLNYNLFA